MNRTLTPSDPDLWRRTGSGEHVSAMVNACAHDCDPLTWPTPAEAATELGSDQDDGMGAFRGLLSWPSMLCAAITIVAICGFVAWVMP